MSAHEFVGGSRHLTVHAVSPHSRRVEVPVIEPLPVCSHLDDGAIVSAYPSPTESIGHRIEVYHLAKVGHRGEQGELVIDWRGFVLDGYWA
jgi:hypothetical protein